jgi:hypothetical protein
MIRFAGRGAGRPVLSVRVDDGVSATIRVDDERNPEYWAELRLNRVDLEALIDAMRAAEEREAIAAGE